MRIRSIALHCIRSLLALGILGLGSAWAQPQPVVSQSSDGNYVVTYTPCSGCYGHGLEELAPGATYWRYLGPGSQTFTNQPAGTYRYRVVYVHAIMPGQYTRSDGPAVSIVVGGSSGAVAPRPTLSTQFAFEYAARSGDLDSDGYRDLLIRRSGSVAADGTIGHVVLRQSRNGTFEPLVPSPGQLDRMQGWRPAPIEIRKRDVNIDGYVDLVLRGVGSAAGFGRADNQILFAPGEAPTAPPGLRRVDAALEAFSRDVNRHLVDPAYYPRNAPVNYMVFVYFQFHCDRSTYGTGLDPYWPWPCFADPQYVYLTYRDISGFHDDAMDVARADYGMLHGQLSTGSGMKRIRQTIEGVLGVKVGGWDIDELLGRRGRVPDRATEQGMELFSALAGIGEAVAQEAGEENGAANDERVLIKGRRVLGQGPFHTVLEFRASTVSAYDSDPTALGDGRLVSEVNWPRDHPSLTMRLGYVDGPAVPPVYWASLVAADRRYDDDLPYDLFPSLGRGGYNSNSFVAGLINATLGTPSVQMTIFVGGERPVPPGAFN